jgi:hypothetical protein
MSRVEALFGVAQLAARSYQPVQVRTRYLAVRDAITSTRPAKRAFLERRLFEAKLGT